MLAEILHQYLIPILFFTGLVAGTVDTIAGGGGLICLPMLLGIGMPPHLALGTNKLQTLFGTAVATYSYYRQGWLSRHGILMGMLFTFCGAVLGAVAIQLISSDILKKIIPVLLFCVLLYSIFSPKFGHHEGEPKMRQNTFYFIFGTLLGFYDGFLGPGTGFFWMFFLVIFLGFSLTKATAYTKVFNLTSNVTAMVCFALGDNIDYRIALYMAAGQIIGGRIGAHLAIKKGAGLIRPMFLLLVTATIVTLIYRNFSQSEAIFSLSNVIVLAALTILIVAAFYLRILRKNRNYC